jgi:hypothetical protein
MIAKCPCDHCGKNIEFATEEFLSGSSVTCPHCGRETFLSVSPKPKPAVSSLSKLPPPKPTAPTIPPPQKFTAPARSTIPKAIWIGAGILVLCALCFASILIGENLQKHSDQTSGTKNNLPPFLQNLLKGKSAATKRPDFPPPPSSGVEFSTKLLENFPERFEIPGTLEGKIGWMDGEFNSIDNLYIENTPYLDIDKATSVGFSIYDKHGDPFFNFYANKAQFGDFLLNLKQFAQIRIIGQARMVREAGTDATFELWLRVDSIQIIK